MEVLLTQSITKSLIYSTTYNQTIVGELDKNYRQISDMFEKLMREEREDQTLQDKLASFEKSTGSTDTSIFDYIRSVIDERNALIN